MKCPECEKEMKWITDQEFEDQFTYEYHCDKCNVDVIKHIEQ